MNKNAQKQTERQLIILAIIAVIFLVGVIVFVVNRDKIFKDNGASTGNTSELSTDSDNTQNIPGTEESEGTEELEDTEDTEDAKETEGTENDTPSEDDKPSTPVDPNPDMYSTESGYTVYDPENTRGLSTEKVPYGFGFATNEEPPQLSIDQQKRFDNMEGVKALSLDIKSTEKVIYLTFDCGYEYENNTAEILDVLKQKNVKAAFFCTLDFIQDCPEKVQRMIDEGHIVGNHSTTHPVFPDITRNKMAKELYGVHKYMLDNYGYECKYFRFPTGAYSHSALELCTSVGYRSVFWSNAYDDWDTKNQKGYDYAFDKVTSRIHPGMVILLHAVSDDNINILPDFIDYAQAKGYKFVTLDDYAW